MEAYKFETTIQENGVIQIPQIAKFAHYEVEVFIVLRPQPKLDINERTPVENFLGKWRGFLEDIDPDELKFQYLQEKYR